jgi:outer membrane protein TolC
MTRPASHHRPTLFVSHLQVEMPFFTFGQRRAAIRDSQEVVQSEQARLKELDLELRQAIAQTCDQIDEIDRTVATLRNDYVKVSNNAELTRTQRYGGLVDELTLLVDELTLIDAESASSRAPALESKEALKRLKYIELQDLSAGMWRCSQ